MFFVRPKRSVTTEDKEWIEDAFLWFEEQHGREFLKNVSIVEPTREFFPIDFKGTRDDVRALTDLVCEYMQIKDVEIELKYFTDRNLEVTSGIFVTRDKNAPGYTLGNYSVRQGKIVIGIEESLMNDPLGLVAVLAHELSHQVLLGEGRIEKNDEYLTDVNTIAMGFGIFTTNSVFQFKASFNGWMVGKRGYIPVEVATYALALLVNYQQLGDLRWTQYLVPNARRMFNRNLKYLRTTSDEIRFK